MRRGKHLAGWGRRSFFAMTLIAGLLWLTGVAMRLWPLDQLLDMAPHEVLLRHGAGIVHGVLSWAFCVMVGRSLWPHARMMWHRQRDAHWLFGMLTLALFGLLTLGGLWLLYGPAESREGMAALHFWIGLGCPLLYLVHTWRRLLAQR